MRLGKFFQFFCSKSINFVLLLLIRKNITSLEVTPFPLFYPKNHLPSTTITLGELTYPLVSKCPN